MTSLKALLIPSGNYVTKCSERPDSSKITELEYTVYCLLSGLDKKRWAEIFSPTINTVVG